MRLLWLLVPVVGAAIAAMAPPPAAGAAEDASRRVLVLHSYHPGFAWTDDIERGLRSVMERATPPVEAHVEYLDTKRHPAPGHISSLLRHLGDKYAGQSFAAIVTSDNNAFHFAAGLRGRLFPGVPIVFCGFNGYEPPLRAAFQPVTGVAEDVDPTRTLDAALSLLPEVRRVVFLSHGTETGMVQRDLARRAAERHAGRVRFEFWNDITLEEAERRAAALERTDLALVIEVLRSETGGVAAIEAVSERIARAGRAPVFGLWSFTLGHGVVGGRMVDGRAQGEEAGRLVLRVLAGEDAAALPVVTADANRFLFDHARLTDFDIPETRLPPGAEVVNRPETLYERHRPLFWSALVVFGALCAVIAVLLHNLARRRRAEAALRDSEERFRLIAEAAPVSIGVSSLEDGRILFCNARYAESAGLTPERLIGRKAAEVMYREPADREALLHHLDDRGVANDVELRAKHADGREQWRLVSMRVMRLNGERALLSAYSDITEQKRAIEAQAAARRQAELADRAKSDFLANMSHELRTPLNSVIGFSELMAAEAFGPLGADRYREYVRDINDSGRHLLDLINDILDLSRIEAGVVDLRDEPVDAVRLIRDCVRVSIARARERGHTLRVEAPADAPALRGDERRIRQMLLNLLSNAIKFTPEGGAIVLRLRAEPGGGLTLEVEDNGIGIDPADIPKVMEPFGQVANVMSRHTHGTGLGLPLTRRFAEQHGATFTLDSAPGRGTRARITFPAVRTLRAAER